MFIRCQLNRVILLTLQPCAKQLAQPLDKFVDDTGALGSTAALGGAASVAAVGGAGIAAGGIGIAGLGSGGSAVAGTGSSAGIVGTLRSRGLAGSGAAGVAGQQVLQPILEPVLGRLNGIRIAGNDGLVVVLFNSLSSAAHVVIAIVTLVVPVLISMNCSLDFAALAEPLMVIALQRIADSHSMLFVSLIATGGALHIMVSIVVDQRQIHDVASCRNALGSRDHIAHSIIHGAAGALDVCRSTGLGAGSSNLSHSSDGVIRTDGQVALLTEAGTLLALGVVLGLTADAADVLAAIAGGVGVALCRNNLTGGDVLIAIGIGVHSVSHRRLPALCVTDTGTGSRNLRHLNQSQLDSADIAAVVIVGIGMSLIFHGLAAVLTLDSMLVTIDSFVIVASNVGQRSDLNRSRDSIAIQVKHLTAGFVLIVTLSTSLTAGRSNLVNENTLMAVNQFTAVVQITQAVVVCISVRQIVRNGTASTLAACPMQTICLSIEYPVMAQSFQLSFLGIRNVSASIGGGLSQNFTAGIASKVSNVTILQAGSLLVSMVGQVRSDVSHHMATASITDTIIVSVGILMASSNASGTARAGCGMRAITIDNIGEAMLYLCTDLNLTFLTTLNVVLFVVNDLSLNVTGCGNLHFLSRSQSTGLAIVVEDVVAGVALVVLLVAILQTLCVLLLNGAQRTDFMLNQTATGLTLAINLVAIPARYRINCIFADSTLLAMSAITIVCNLKGMLCTSIGLATNSAVLPVSSCIGAPSIISMFNVSITVVAAAICSVTIDTCFYILFHVALSAAYGVSTILIVLVLKLMSGLTIEQITTLGAFALVGLIGLYPYSGMGCLTDLLTTDSAVLPMVFRTAIPFFSENMLQLSFTTWCITDTSIVVVIVICGELVTAIITSRSMLTLSVIGISSKGMCCFILYTIATSAILFVTILVLNPLVIVAQVGNHSLCFS